MFAPDNLGPTVRITAFTLTAFSTVVVGMRFGCRIWVVGKLKVYDYIMLAALLCTWALCIENHFQIVYGTGGQTPKNAPPITITPELLAHWNKILVGGAISWFTYRITYVLCLGLIKISILVFYLTFATQRTFRNLVIIWLFLVTIFTIVTGFLNGFECPRDPSLTLSAGIFDEQRAKQCLHRPTLYYCQAAFNIVSDTAILVLPMPSLLQLRMLPLKRASIIAVFSVGLLVPIASGFRIWGLYLWATSGSNARYTGAYMLFWSQVEINTAIVCASTPSLQPLFKLIFGRLVTYHAHSAYYFYGNAANDMAEAETGGARPIRRADSDSLTFLDSPTPSYQPNKWDTSGTGNELALIRNCASPASARCPERPN